MTVVYLAGPMRNCLNHNTELFRLWQARLRAEGFTVETPLDYDFDHGFDPRGTGFEEDDAPRMLDMRRAMAYSMDFICTKADCLAVLPGWERSVGAHAQVLVAWRMHLPVYSAPNLWGFGLEAPQTEPRGHREGLIA